ncbi:MAG: SGNH/GDSL hydrolase family protein [Psychroserpens sp.]|nr:SGNH/GDSL hydrolase family protein [Psychroserpens sp.]
MKKNYLWLLAILLCIGCSSDDPYVENLILDNTVNQIDDQDPDPDPNDNTNDPVDTSEIKILSLGDSYTIGQGVCVTCRFPVQLKDSISNRLNRDTTVDIIAQTGWTTTVLFDAIVEANPSTDHDLVTLLIGVNNQYQGKPFSLYEQEFPQLVSQAVALANGEPNRVIVISIPDYAYTLFGQNFGNPVVTSSEIDMYNAFAEQYCMDNNISFVNITDISRLGLEQPELVASDNLHPSELAYTLFVKRLIPVALEKIN